METAMKDMNYNSGMVLAMGYVPWQKWKDIYPPAVALANGTMFAELNKPFKGGRR